MKFYIGLLGITGLLLFVSTITTRAQSPDYPLIGAQVFIEPGQTQEQVEHWFQMLKNNGMQVCRIRIHESHIHQPDGSWDFSRYDHAFTMAHKYGIRVFATIYPASRELGGDKFPYDDDNFQSIAVFIKMAVNHLKQFPALYCWVLQNEPGVNGKLPVTPFTAAKRNEWLKSNGYKEGHEFEELDNARFLLEYETWYLQWLAKEVARYDPQRPTHLNNHRAFDNIAEYDFPAWRQFLGSLGASMHPSWHFGYFARHQYNYAVSANCALIRSGAGPLPFWVTELQGGTNLYSAFQPLCPTAQEITQWVWTAIGSGARGLIFWTLNPRRSGKEAGEWGMLDYQNQPADRLLAAGKIAACIADEPLFKNAKPLTAPVHILYARSALWTESLSQWSNPQAMPAERSKGAVIQSALAYYEALAEQGINSNLGELGEFNWSLPDYAGQTVILPHQLSIPRRYYDSIYAFTERGGKLMVSGLTGFFDENWQTTVADFPFRKLFGATLKEVRYTGDRFNLPMSGAVSHLQASVFQGWIKNDAATVVGRQGAEITAVRNRYGKGEVIWMPSNIALAARGGEDSMFAAFVKMELKQSLSTLPFSFRSRNRQVMMTVMQSDAAFITILANASSTTAKLSLQTPKGYHSKIIFSNGNDVVRAGNSIAIAGGRTIVVKWTPELKAIETKDTSFYLFLLMGQSNMAGRGVPDNDTLNPHEGIFMMNKQQQWVPARDPVHFDKKEAGVGPALSFAAAIRSAYPHARIGLIPCAVGGTSISKWKAGAFDEKTGTHPYDDMTVRLRAALPRGVLKAVLWHQGEGDSSPAAIRLYPARLAALVSNVRALAAMPELPFIAGEVGYFDPTRDVFNAMIKTMPDIVNNMQVVSAGGLSHKGDNLHFNTGSARLLGRRYAQAFLQMTH